MLFFLSMFLNLDKRKRLRTVDSDLTEFVLNHSELHLVLHTFQQLIQKRRLTSCCRKSLVERKDMFRRDFFVSIFFLFSFVYVPPKNPVRMVTGSFFTSSLGLFDMIPFLSFFFFLNVSGIDF